MTNLILTFIPQILNHIKGNYMHTFALYVGVKVNFHFIPFSNLLNQQVSNQMVSIDKKIPNCWGVIFLFEWIYNPILHYIREYILSSYYLNQQSYSLNYPPYIFLSKSFKKRKGFLRSHPPLDFCNDIFFQEANTIPFIS